MYMQKTKRVPTQVHSRKLDRMVAHANMKRAGVRNINKCEYSHYYSITGAVVSNRLGSYFSKYWRHYV